MEHFAAVLVLLYFVKKKIITYIFDNVDCILYINFLNFGICDILSVYFDFVCKL